MENYAFWLQEDFHI